MHFERLKTALFRTRERTRFDQAAADRILPASLRSEGQRPAGVIGIRPEHGAILFFSAVEKNSHFIEAALAVTVIAVW